MFKSRLFVLREALVLLGFAGLSALAQNCSSTPAFAAMVVYPVPLTGVTAAGPPRSIPSVVGVSPSDGSLTATIQSNESPDDWYAHP